MSARSVLAVILLGLGVLTAGVAASPAGADLTGSCTGSASFSKGLEQGGPFTVSAEDLKSDKTITVPRADSVAWTGEVTGATAGSRKIDGFVAVDLPWPLGAIDIDSWGGASAKTASSGTHDYDLPSVVPAGVVFHVVGEHHETGVDCVGGVSVKIEGGAFDSWLTPVALGLTAALGAILLFAGLKGHAVLGALSGLGALLVGGVALALLGVIPTNSVVLTVAPMAGLVLGGLWGGLRHGRLAAR